MRVLLVEDNATFAALLAKLLTEHGYAVDLAATREAAESALAVADYALIVLDLTLPDGDGRDLLRALRRAGKGTLVLAATARGHLADRVQTLDAGADDYLVKPFAPEELLARARALLRRPHELQPNLLALGNLALDTAAQSLTVAGAPVELARRELAVLTELLSSRGKLLRRERLADAIYPFDAEVTPNAIEAAVSRLRRRLDAAGATVSITAMRGLGYLLTARESC